MNSTDDFTFVQYDPLYLFGAAVPAPTPRPPIKPAKMMPGVNIQGSDSPHPCPAAAYGNKPLSCEGTVHYATLRTIRHTPYTHHSPYKPLSCKAECKAKSGCVGWTLHYNDPSRPVPGWRCCTKTAINGLARSDQNTTSGILNPAQVPSNIYRSVDQQAQEERSDDEGGAVAAALTSGGAVAAAPAGGNVTFSEFYNLQDDPWQVKQCIYQYSVVFSVYCIVYSVYVEYSACSFVQSPSHTIRGR
jgi:hypothetical protein